MQQPRTRPTLRDQLVQRTAVISGRLAIAARRSDRLRAAAALTRAAGQVITGDTRSVRQLLDQPDELQQALADLLFDDAAGRPIDPERLRDLRSLAVHNRLGDTDGRSIVALRALADRFDDPGSQAWLGPALAEAGRLTEAVEQPLSFGGGRPRPRHYPIVVSALELLGRHDEARERMLRLQERFPALRQEFVHVWGDDPVAVGYRRLVERSPGAHGALPVFQHLPFCAGSSMQFSLQLIAPWGRTAQIGRRSGLEQIAELTGRSSDRIAELTLVHQHHPYPLELPGRQLSHFTVLRDPVSQLRSGFYKRGARETIVTTRDIRSRTFEQHAEYTLSAGLTNMLSRMIVSGHPDLRAGYRRHFDSPAAFSAIRNEEDMFWLRATRRFGDERLLRMARETLDADYAVVGTMSHLRASHLACTATLGLPIAHALGHRGRSGQPRKPTDSDTDRRLREANAVDQELFDDYTERFAREHADLIAALEQPFGTAVLTGSAAAGPASSAAAPAPARTCR